VLCYPMSAMLFFLSFFQAPHDASISLYYEFCCHVCNVKYLNILVSTMFLAVGASSWCSSFARFSIQIWE